MWPPEVCAPARWWGAGLGGWASHHPTHRRACPLPGLPPPPAGPVGPDRPRAGRAQWRLVGAGLGPAALRPSSQGPEAQLPSSVLRRVATPGASPWSGPQSLPGMQRAGVASRCRWPRCSPGLTCVSTPLPPPPAVQTLRLCSHLGPSPRCGWSQFSQPGHDLGPADQPRGTSGRRGVPPPDRPGARVWSWPLSAPSSLQASGLLQPFAACAWPSAVLFFLEVVSGRLSDHPVALSFAAAHLLGLQGEAAASGRPEAPRQPAGTRLERLAPSPAWVGPASLDHPQPPSQAGGPGGRCGAELGARCVCGWGGAHGRAEVAGGCGGCVAVSGHRLATCWVLAVPQESAG